MSRREETIERAVAIFDRHTELADVALFLNDLQSSTGQYIGRELLKEGKTVDDLGRNRDLTPDGFLADFCDGIDVFPDSAKTATKISNFVGFCLDGECAVFECSMC